MQKKLSHKKLIEKATEKVIRKRRKFINKYIDSLKNKKFDFIWEQTHKENENE
jgi:hypothetical protein